MHIGREQGINQLLYARHDICDYQLSLDLALLKMLWPLKRTFLLNAIDEKDLLRLSA